MHWTTLFQDKHAYGDFKANFDHYTRKAKYDDRTKIDMFRKRLSRNAVISNQVKLPALDDWATWMEMTDNIARNQQQEEHVAKLKN